MAEPTIKDYIRAGYPCLFMRTVEPEVAERALREALEELGMGQIDFGVWKATTGLQVGKADTSMTSVTERAQDLLDALAVVETSEQPMVVVFHNVRQFVANYQIIQQMLDTAAASRLKGSHIVLVGPHIDLPVEMKTVVTFIDCPLPTQKEIREEYRKIVTAYEDEIELPSKGDELEGLLKDAATAAVGLDMMGAENAIALSLATSEKVDLHVIQSQKEQEVRKSDVLEFFPTAESLNTVGGMSELKLWLHKRRRVFTEEAREYGLPYPKGMLIVGPAGTGKSLTAKAVSTFLKLPLLRLDMGKVFRSLVGESESAIRQALKVTEAVSPVVLWLDEIDKGLAGMKGSGELDSGVTARVVSTILTWRQETTYPVMLVATANEVVTLPAMIYRKGRLDEVWATDLPHEDEREEIFRIHIEKRGREVKKFNLSLLAQTSPDFTGSEIEGCIEDAMFSAFDDNKEVSSTYIMKALKETIPQATRDREELTSIREWVKTRARLASGPAKEGKKAKGSKVRQIRKNT